MLIRECAATDIEALERHMPTRPGQVHAEHFGQQQAGRWTYMIAWDDNLVPVGVCVIRWGGWAEREALDAYPDCPEVTKRAATLYARLGYTDTGLRTDSRYVYTDDAGVPREIVEHNILLVKNLDVISPAEGTDSASDGRS